MTGRKIAWAGAIAALGASTTAAAGPTGTLEVAAFELKRTEGEVVCALYDRADAFPSETNVYAGAYAKVADRRAVCRFEGVPAGRYAVAAFHDEDGDRKLKTVLGLPREGFGFSNDAKPGAFGPPRFVAAAFDFDGKSKRLSIRVNYP
ncbi:MAG: DUF2141 domain-containing protein [Polyangiaceae bacterium]|nr:DUF2141 domain-containing protein [Polyangiaceae bacterium]